MNLSLSPPVFCTTCKQNRPAADFPRRRNGGAYKTCKHCKARRGQRPPLRELDPNIRATRGATDQADDEIRPRKRPRQREIQVYEDR